MAEVEPVNVTERRYPNRAEPSTFDSADISYDPPEPR